MMLPTWEVKGDQMILTWSIGFVKLLVVTPEDVLQLSLQMVILLVPGPLSAGLSGSGAGLGRHLGRLPGPRPCWGGLRPWRLDHCSAETLVTCNV